VKKLCGFAVTAKKQPDYNTIATQPACDGGILSCLAPPPVGGGSACASGTYLHTPNLKKQADFGCFNGLYMLLWDGSLDVCVFDN